MIKFAKNAAIAALLAVTALPVTASFASADDFDGYYDGPRVQHVQDNYWGGSRRGCNPRMAEDIARDYGMRRARVSDVTPRRVIVEGRNRGGWDRMVFANVRGCPLLRR